MQISQRVYISNKFPKELTFPTNFPLIPDVFLRVKTLYFPPNGQFLGKELPRFPTFSSPGIIQEPLIDRYIVTITCQFINDLSQAPCQIDSKSMAIHFCWIFKQGLQCTHIIPTHSHLSFDNYGYYACSIPGSFLSRYVVDELLLSRCARLTRTYYQNGDVCIANEQCCLCDDGMF